MSRADLGSHTSDELADRPPALLLLPLGATEQHGPHLPLDTDTVIAVRWAEAIAHQRPGAVVGPALAYGSSGEHQGFAGTLSLGREALSVSLVELTRSAASSFSGVVFVCGHAGNASVVDEVVGQLRNEGHRAVGLLPAWPTAPEHLPRIDAHAGRVETSLMLHLAPQSVHLDRMEPGRTEPLSELLDQLMTGGMAAVSANGVLGDPRGANADEGARLFDDLVRRSLETLGRWLADC